MPAEFDHCAPKTLLPNTEDCGWFRKKASGAKKAVFPVVFAPLQEIITGQAAYFGRSFGQNSPESLNKLARRVLEPFTYGLQGTGGRR